MVLPRPQAGGKRKIGGASPPTSPSPANTPHTPFYLSALCFCCLLLLCPKFVFVCAFALAAGPRGRNMLQAAQQAVATNSAQKPSFKPAPPLVSIKKVAAVKPKRESSPLPPFF